MTTLATEAYVINDGTTPNTGTKASVQFNADGVALGGDSSFTYDPTTKVLEVPSASVDALTLVSALGSPMAPFTLDSYNELLELTGIRHMFSGVDARTQFSSNFSIYNPNNGPTKLFYSLNKSIAIDVPLVVGMKKYYAHNVPTIMIMNSLLVSADTVGTDEAHPLVLKFTVSVSNRQVTSPDGTMGVVISETAYPLVGHLNNLGDPAGALVGGVATFPPSAFQPVAMDATGALTLNHSTINIWGRTLGDIDTSLLGEITPAGTYGLESIGQYPVHFQNCFWIEDVLIVEVIDPGVGFSGVTVSIDGVICNTYAD